MFPCSHSLFPSPSSGNSSRPLIGPPCHVRPVLPTGHPAVFLLDKGKAIGSPLCRTAPEDAADSVPPSTNTARAEGGGSKGARPPSPGVQGPGGPWRIFAYFLYARK